MHLRPRKDENIVGVGHQEKEKCNDSVLGFEYFFGL